MASKYWIKLYHEILHDPKMGRLPDKIWRRCIELFLLAGEFDQDGILPGIEEICWTLRITIEECNETLQQLQHLNVAHCNDDGTWIITHFAERQDASTSTERSRAHRRRARQQEQLKPFREAETGTDSQQTGDNNATELQRNVAPDKDTDTDKESTPNGVGEKSPEAPPDSKPETLPDEKPDGKKALMGTFLTETRLTMPRKKNTVGFWWSNIQEIHELANRDVDIGQRLIKQAVKALKDKQLTIGGPESIIKTCRALAAGQAIGGNNNGHETRYKPPTVDLDAYRHLEAQNAVRPAHDAAANTGAAGRAGPAASRDRPAE